MVNFAEEGDEALRGRNQVSDFIAALVRQGASYNNNDKVLYYYYGVWAWDGLNEDGGEEAQQPI